jgi:hypothetical protein
MNPVAVRVKTRRGTSRTTITQTDLKSRDKLGEGDQKKVEVEKELELFIKYDGKERERVIFLISYAVRRESRLQFF